MLAWEKFLLNQEKELGKETADKWLKPLKVLNFDACNLFLEASDRFQILWFEEHVRKKALAELKNNNNKSIRVHLNLAGSKPFQKIIRSKNAIEPSFKLSIE